MSVCTATSPDKSCESRAIVDDDDDSGRLVSDRVSDYYLYQKYLKHYPNTKFSPHRTNLQYKCALDRVLLHCIMALDGHCFELLFTTRNIRTYGAICMSCTGHLEN